MRFQLIRCTLVQGEYTEQPVRLYSCPIEAMKDKLYEETEELNPFSWWTVEVEEDDS
jgi:hypothetical protein